MYERAANGGASARRTTVNEIETGSAYETAAIESNRMCPFVGSVRCLKVGNSTMALLYDSASVLGSTFQHLVEVDVFVFWSFAFESKI